jgi:hypothetical protein
LSGRGFECFGRNEFAHAGSLAYFNLGVRSAGQQGGETQAS